MVPITCNLNRYSRLRQDCRSPSRRELKSTLAALTGLIDKPQGLTSKADNSHLGQAAMSVRVNTETGAILLPVSVLASSGTPGLAGQRAPLRRGLG